MTEQEWLECTDPQRMFDFICHHASDRKLRLLSVACCRRIWHLLSDERSRRAVNVAEAFAEGMAEKDDLEVARIEAKAAARLVAGRNYPSSYQRKVAQLAAEAAADVTSKKVRKAVCTIASSTAEAAAEEAGLEGARSGLAAHARATKLSSESEGQRALLIECLGPLPFHPVAVEPSWLRWNEDLVRRLGGMIYAERELPDGHLDRTRLGILADALEDAGCGNAAILNHCRLPGVHVRGYWLVDLLLGKG